MLAYRWSVSDLKAKPETDGRKELIKRHTKKLRSYLQREVE